MMNIISWYYVNFKNYYLPHTQNFSLFWLFKYVPSWVIRKMTAKMISKKGIHCTNIMTMYNIISFSGCLWHSLQSLVLCFSFVALATNCLKSQPNWMDELPDKIKSLGLDSLFLPGTHDSGAYDTAQKLPIYFEKYVYTQVSKNIGLSLSSIINYCCQWF